MAPVDLIPTPDTIPAPAWLFVILELFTFTLHILLINVVIGGTLILLFSRLRGSGDSLGKSFHGEIAGKIPTTIALGINLGVAPLLFVQVIYGNLFYASSVLMAVYWILIIPILILAYYGAYIHIRKYETAAALSKLAILVTGIFVLYIAFMFVNNITLMEQPQKWTAYFGNRGGTILNIGDPILIPRYLHFITASVAVAGLFLAILWHFRKKKDGEIAQKNVRNGLKIFAIATAVQIVIGFWFLLAIPSDFVVQFMGRNLFYTIFLFGGMLVGIGAMVAAFLGKLWLTVGHLIATIILMIITRDNLRALYLQDQYSLSTLQLTPQYGVLVLFLVIFVIGLGSVAYMLNIAATAKEGGTAS